MAKSTSKKEEPEGIIRFNKEQYEMLIRCSDNKDMSEWNEFRQEHPEEDILLEGADLNHSNLKGVRLNKAYLKNAQLMDANLQDAFFFEANLEGANLCATHLENADLSSAHLEHANLSMSYMEGAKLMNAHLEEVDLTRCHLKRVFLAHVSLQGAKLTSANLEGAYLGHAHLEGSDLIHAILERANISGADLSRVNLGGSNLKGVTARMAIVDGSTLFSGCIVDRNTDFRGVGLDSSRMEIELKQLLKYNIKHLNWKDWYDNHWFLQWPVRLFWSLSDYGWSTKRIIFSFSIIAFVFAAIYYGWGAIDYYLLGVKDQPGIVNNLFTVENISGQQRILPEWLLPFRAIYFSIVTMTTLGFGDMYAKYESFWGHLFLTVQVIAGYIMLGALLVRFANLFSSDGPSCTFVETWGQSNDGSWFVRWRRKDSLKRRKEKK